MAWSVASRIEVAQTDSGLQRKDYLELELASGTDSSWVEAVDWRKGCWMRTFAAVAEVEFGSIGRDWIAEIVAIEEATASALLPLFSAASTSYRCSWPHGAG